MALDKKPERIIINRWLSGINGWFTLYYLIISAMKAPNEWWYITPVAFAVVLLFISLVKDQNDEPFDI